MYYLPVDTINGVQQEKVYEIKELSYLGKLLNCKESKKREIHYLEIPCAFDIETTNMYVRNELGHIEPDPRPYAFMYHWQFCLDDEVCFGRTWEEFQELIKNLQERMNLRHNNRIVIWVHNLAFEFQFMRRFLNVTDGFYKDEKKPLKVVVDDCIEFRDSYALSNMTLAKFCENERGVIHYKLSGEEFDYNKVRTALTPLSDKEKAYCYNDVRGLCECIRSRLLDDTLATIPMTSTGYVRRECRKNMQKNKRNRAIFVRNQLNEITYGLCREAFRGGDTHANVRYANQELHDIDSWDITSSYPANMTMDDTFPDSPFEEMKVSTFENRDLTEYVYLIKIRLSNVKYIGACGIPYIAYSKCSGVSGALLDNGRIRKADFIELTVTSIDWEIIKHDYIFDDIWYNKIYVAHRGMLPAELRESIMEYYRLKTELKGIEDKEYEYMKSKNKLNAIYGMSVMRIDQDSCIYENGEYIIQKAKVSEALEKYYKSRNSFLSYQHGIFVTANSRKRLRDMLWIVGRDVVYCDTDSIKCLNNHNLEFEAKNEEIKKRAIECGAYAEDKNGKVRYLGVWDHEGRQYPTYEKFKTLGAKKYVVVENGEYKSTIAGVSKKVGEAFFTANGLESFAIGTKIEDSGHLVAYYNDDDIHKIKIDGCIMTIASNVALVDDTYTIGITSDYLDLLNKALANMSDIIYT